MNLPIAFIHTGYSSYLEFSLRQARHVSPNSTIILLGDQANDRFDFVKHVDISAFFRRAEAFAETYQHYSTNPYHYELFCFQRWIVLDEYVKSAGHPHVFACDSDVLWYCDTNKYAQSLFDGYDVGLAIARPESVTAGISYWTASALHDFCVFLEELYFDNRRLQEILQLWQHNRENKILGGYSDMTAVRDFLLEDNKYRFYNLLEVNNGATFDKNINTQQGAQGDAYSVRFGKKRLHWRRSIPYGHHTRLDTEVRFRLLHFQGPAKYMMAQHYTGPDFPGKQILFIKYRILNIAAFIYKTLRIRYLFAPVFALVFKLRRQLA